MKKVVSKGYTLTVDSWENDADNCRTKTKNVATEDKARLLHKMCKELFCSSNNGRNGIGNLCEGDERVAMATIVDFFEVNKEAMIKGYPQLADADQDELYDCVLSIAYDLLGGSEWYVCRVCDGVSVTFAEEDTFLQEVTF